MTKEDRKAKKAVTHSCHLPVSGVPPSASSCWLSRFPRLTPLVIWPRLALPTPERPPFPAWGLETLHGLAATAFWVVIGLWAYRRHDFGSRIPTK